MISSLPQSGLNKNINEAITSNCRQIWYPDQPMSFIVSSIVTGRNEVLAKVIFLHLSVIHSVHRGGVQFLAGGLQFFGGAPIFQGGVLQFFLGILQFFGGGSNFSGGLQFFWREYGQRLAGTHPTGMYSCWRCQ